MSIIITLIRHGQTNDNLNQIIQGQIDTPLNDYGISQSKLTGTYLNQTSIFFDEIWSSDLQRAQKTATVIAESQPKPINVQTDIRLRERFLGDLQGKKRTSNADQSTAEPISNVLKRLLEFWNELTFRLETKPTRSDPQRILIVSHGAALRTLIESGLKASYKFDSSQSIIFGNCSITEIEHLPQKRILRAGYLKHLDLVESNQTEVKSSVDDI
ncbi:histidine phosphatase superfamily [Melampsora americana]|nr:histidine phosphatase superfamily [Melampsora americana]